MTQSLQVRQEKEASFTDFLLYFLRLGTVGFGGPIALASRMESDLVAGEAMNNLLNHVLFEYFTW